MATSEFDSAFDDAFGATQSDPLTEEITNIKRETVSKMKVSMNAAADVNPDQRADVLRIANERNLPVGVVERGYETFAKASKTQNIDFDKMAEESPYLAGWLGDPDNAAVAQDDLDSINDLRETVKDRGELEKMYNTLGYGFASLNARIAKTPAIVADAYYQYGVNPLAKAFGYSEVKPFDGLRNNALTNSLDNAAEAYQAKVPELSQDVLAHLEKGDFSKAARATAYQVVANLPQQALTIGGAMLGTPAVGLGVSALTAASGEYDEAKDQNVETYRAINNAILSGSAEALGESLGTLPLLKKWGATVGARFGKDTWGRIVKDVSKMVALSMAQEGVEESATSAMQDLSSVTTGVNPDLTIREAGRNLVNSAIIGGVSGGVITSPAGAAMGVARRHDMQMVQNTVDFYQAIGDKVKDMKLRKRLPKKAQEVVEQLTKDGPVENVYIKPEDFKTYFQSKNLDPLEAATLYGVAQEYQEASETGADIRVPLAKFVSNLVETEHYQGLKNSVKFNPDALTYNEAQQEKEKTKADLKLIAKEAEQDEETVPTRIQQAREVKRVIKDRLLEMNNAMIGPSEADQYAVLHAQALSSLAEKSGMSPMDLLNRYGLKIQTQEGVFDVVPSQDVAMASQGQVLNQQGAKTYAEVVESARRSGNPDILSGSSFATQYGKNQRFAEQLLPVSSLYRGDETPSQVLSLEDGPQMNEAGELIGGDEFYAQKYSKDFASGSTAEPIIAHPDGRGGFEIIDGRHRARAAFLRGETQIRAFVPVLDESTQLFQSSAAQAVADQFVEPASPTFSKLIQVVEQKMGGSANPQEIRAMLKEVKEEEKKWLGLEEFLAGKEKVKKQDLLDFLRANEPEIVDVTKGGARSMNEGATVWRFFTEDGDFLGTIANEDNIESKRAELAQELEVDVDQITAQKGEYSDGETIEDADDIPDDQQPTKYKDYTLPGGENYREVLFTLPEKAPPTLDENNLPGGHWLQIDENAKSDKYRWKIRDKQGRIAGLGATKEEAIANFQRVELKQTGDNYTSSHFDEKNVLAHVRLNDRTDADGKKVLFIEEIQSDWHQEGRKKGYRETASPEKVAQAKEIVAAFQSDFEKNQELQKKYGISNEDAVAIARGGETNGVPDAPFKKTWHEYAMKRIVRMAAEGGYDRIAWTTGEQQADRFDLSKQVDEVQAKKNKDGTYKITVIKGDSVIEDVPSVKESDLEAQLGKDLAKKIIAEEGKPTVRGSKNRSYTGIDLKVGGEGMKGFYDKILVDYAKKFGKKFGATVGETEVDSGEGRSVPSDQYEILQSEDTAEYQIIDTMNGDDIVNSFEERADAQSALDKLIDEQSGGVGFKVHSLDVTDKMKEVALGQGFELFQSKKLDPFDWRGKGVSRVKIESIPFEKMSFGRAESSLLSDKSEIVATIHNGAKIRINEIIFGETDHWLVDKKDSMIRASLTDEEVNASAIVAKHLDKILPTMVQETIEPNEKKGQSVRKDKIKDFRRLYGIVDIGGDEFAVKLKVARYKDQAEPETAYIEYAKKLKSPARSQALNDPSLEPQTASPARADITIVEFAEKINSIRDNDPYFQGDASESDPRARIVISSNKSMRIDLFKKADLSSFLHETGHFYLEIIDDLVKDPRTSQSLKDDYEKIRTWLGAKPGEKLTVDQHEQWARGFELYLASGKAPSTELKRAFAHFKVWLTKIYANLKNLNVELNDEIIGVMDRLVATDEQLQAALLDQQPLFENPLEMGMSPEQSEKYKKLDNDRKREASEKLTQEAIKSEMQKRQAAYKAARKEVKDRIEKEANEKRVYRALAILQKGKMPDGSPLPEGSQKIKLDRDSIVRVYGKEFLETLPRPFVYTREGGVDFNIAAEMLGYQSGDELLKSIAGMPSKDEYVERETEREMKLRFPDEVMEEFPEQAIRAAHNESRGKMLYFELETLARDNLPLLKDAIKRVARRVPTEKEVRATARGMIAKKQMKEIRPSVFERAERKAAKEAGEALAKGDIYGAFEAKRRELLNFELYRAAIEAQELNEKALEFFKKFKGKDEDIAKTRDTDLVNVGRAILAQYGLGRTEKTPEQYLEMMKRYDQENYDSAIALIQNSGLVPGPYKEISFDEFSTMYETVRAIWDLAKSARSVEIDGVRMDKEQIKAELIGKINELAAPGNRPGYDKAVTDWDKTKMRLLGAKASLRRVESWVSAVDGDSKGIFRKYIWNPISEATAKYRIEKVKVLKQYQDLVQEWAKNSDGFQTPIVAENLGYTFGGKVELLGAILHTGNESNLEKLLVGRGWGQRLDDDTLDTSRWDAFMLKMYRDGVITKADMDFAQKVWDLMETLKPDAQRAHKAMYGFYFNEITANELITPFGIYRGGYVPAITDSVMVEDNAINQEKESLKQNNSAMYPTAGRGFTKSRVEQYAAPLAMDLKLVGSHIDKVLRFIHIEPSVKQVARVVMDKEFRANLANLDPVIGQDMLVPWLQRAAQQAVSVPMKGWAGKAIDTFAKELRKRSGLQTMFFNVTNTMQQVTGFTIAAVKVKPKYLRNALWRYIKAPKEFSDAVISKSKFMEGRSATQVMEVNKIIDELAINPTKFEQYRDFVQEHGYFLQSAAQGMVDMTVWTGAYEEAVERGESEKEAVRFADSVVRETQGSMNPEDMSRFESGTALTRLFTMFYSYFNMQANLLGTEGAKTIRDLGLRKGAGRLLYVYTMGFMLPAWFSTLIVQAMGNGIDEDDDEQYLDDLLQSFFTSQFSTATAMFPIVGPIINRVALSFNDKPYDDRITLSPAISMIESAGGAPLSVYKAIADDGSKKKAVRDVMSAIGLLSGIPTGPVQRPLSYLVDVSEGEADPTGPIDFTRGLVTGKPGQVQ